MDLSHIQLNLFKVTKEHDFQKLGKEISDYCGSPAYFLFARYNHEKIKDAFIRLQKTDKKDIKYLIGIIKRL